MTINEEMLSAYLDGELSGDERAMVEQRIADEPALHKTLAELEFVRTQIRQLPRHSLSPDFAAGVTQAIVAAEEQSKVNLPTSKESSSNPGRTYRYGILASVALLIFIGVIGLRNGANKPSKVAMHDNRATSDQLEEGLDIPGGNLGAVRMSEQSSAEGVGVVTNSIVANKVHSVLEQVRLPADVKADSDSSESDGFGWVVDLVLSQRELEDLESRLQGSTVASGASYGASGKHFVVEGTREQIANVLASLSADHAKSVQERSFFNFQRLESANPTPTDAMMDVADRQELQLADSESVVSPDAVRRKVGKHATLEFQTENHASMPGPAGNLRKVAAPPKPASRSRLVPAPATLQQNVLASDLGTENQPAAFSESKNEESILRILIRVEVTLPGVAEQNSKATQQP